MSSNQITAELREYVRAVRAYHLTDIHGKKREYVDATTQKLTVIADRIDKECERDLMVLPRDMDGVPIHIGDEMQWRNGERFSVVAIGDDAVFFDDGEGYEYSTPDCVRHYHKPTVEELLDEMYSALDDSRIPNGSESRSYDEIISEYADRIRELIGNE